MGPGLKGGPGPAGFCSGARPKIVLAPQKSQLSIAVSIGGAFWPQAGRGRGRNGRRDVLRRTVPGRLYEIKVCWEVEPSEERMSVIQKAPAFYRGKNGQLYIRELGPLPQIEQMSA